MLPPPPPPTLFSYTRSSDLHFGSKEELLRRVADQALASVELPPPSPDWRADLRHVAAAYRDLAHRHPRIFHLHFRFHATGPAEDRKSTRLNSSHSSSSYAVF